MIFITIGTQQQIFKRLFEYVNQIDTDEKIIIQKGKNDYHFKEGVEAFDYLSYEEMDKYIRGSRVIITHGGAGTIFKALELKKKLIVVPRLAKYHEHINDHQLEFCEYLKKKNYCFVVRDKKEFNDALKNIENHHFREYQSHQKEFVDNIEKEIESLLELI